MNPRPFKQVDVFSPRLGSGNALAVVLDAQGLSCLKPPSSCRPVRPKPTTGCASSPPAANSPSLATPPWEAATLGWSSRNWGLTPII